jgi:hopanoid-associated phosphorylase
VITGLVVALPEELSTLTAQKIAKGCCAQLWDNVLLAHSGTGPENAQAAAQQLIAQGATRLISWGCAAALSEQLKPGDLSLAAFLIHTDTQKDTDVSAAWHAYCKTLLAELVVLHTEPLLESKRIVSSSREKKRLFEQTGASALDMESAAVARVARQHHCPFLAIRAIADPVNMDLPQAITYALNAQGEVLLGRLLTFVALHPGELPGLIRLGLQFNAARKTLKIVAAVLDNITGFNHLNAAVL